MVKQFPLMHPWERVDPTYFGDDEATRLAFDRALGIRATEGLDWETVPPAAHGLPPAQKALTAEGEQALHYRWELLRNVETGGRALVRVQRVDGRIRGFSALIFLPSEHEILVHPGDPRSFSVVNSARAYDTGNAASLANLNASIQVATGEWDPSQPLGEPDGSKEFYARVAVQFREIEKDGPGATKRFAEHNGANLKTAQRWLTRARKLGLLPPAPAGRQRKASSDGLD